MKTLRKDQINGMARILTAFLTVASPAFGQIISLETFCQFSFEQITWLFVSSGLLIVAWVLRRKLFVLGQRPPGVSLLTVPAVAITIGAGVWFGGTTATAQGPVIFTGLTASKHLEVAAEDANAPDLTPLSTARTSVVIKAHDQVRIQAQISPELDD